MQLMTFEDMTYELRRTNRRLESAQSELRELVITDALTGCRNRRFFDEVIGREMQRHRRYGIPLSLAVHRHRPLQGRSTTRSGTRPATACSSDVAAFLVRNIREADYVFRWGGDEFLILISCRLTAAERKASELKTIFSRTETATLPEGVGLSVGCAEVSADVTHVMAIVKDADERMYRDKKGE